MTIQTVADIRTHPVTLAEILATAAHDGWVMAGAAILPLALAAAAYLTAAPSAVSTARLLILPSADYAARSAPGSAPGSVGLSAAQMVAAELELAGNRGLLAATVDDAGVTALYPDLAPAQRDVAIQRLQAAVSVEPVNAASAIRVRVRHRDPARATLTLRAMLRAYFALRPRVLGDDSTDLVDQQERAMEARLVAAEDTLAGYDLAHGIADLSSQRARLLQLDADLRDDMRDARTDIAARTASLEAVRAQLAAEPRQVRAAASDARSLDLENAKTALLTYALRRKDLINRTSEDNRAVADVDLQIATVRGFIASEPPRVQTTARDARNPALGELERRVATLGADLAGARARADTIAGQGDAITRDLAALNAAATEHDRLEAARDMLATALRDFVPHAEEARADDLAASHGPVKVRLIEAPTPPEITPVNTPVFALAGGVGAVVAALVAAVIRASLRRTFVLSAEIPRELGQPVLMTIPRVTIPRVTIPRARARPPHRAP